MKSTSQHAVNMINRNESLSAGRQLLIDEFTISKRVFILLVGVLFIVCGVLFGGNFITQLLKMPIEQVDVRGDLKFVNQQKLQSVVAHYMHEGYLTENLSFIKAELEKLPWIYTARLQRSWPNKLYIDVVEQNPVAVWADQGLINENGEVFLPENFAKLNINSLPQIIGPSDRMEQTWLRYSVLKEVFSTYNLGIRKLELDEKGGQKIVLNNGIHVILGSQDLEQRLSRFFKVYKNYLVSRRKDIKSIDLRYTNGVAVSWLDKEKYAVAHSKY